MTRLHERIGTTLPADDAFAYLSDFANAAEWDPGVATAVRIGGPELGVGTRYRLGIRRGDRILPMEYRITSLEPHRVVLSGEGRGVRATDEIRVEPSATGSIVDYTADIRLTGVLRFAQPFLGRLFRGIAEGAAEGIRSTLERRADGTRPAVPAEGGR
jgi:carbon monoxide dehydrogenase subunit G